VNSDIEEASNPALAHPEGLTSMLAKLDALESQLKEPLWGPRKIEVDTPKKEG